LRFSREGWGRVLTRRTFTGRPAGTLKDDAIVCYRNGILSEGFIGETLKDMMNRGFGYLAISNYLLHEEADAAFDQAQKELNGELKQIERWSQKLKAYQKVIQYGRDKVEASRRLQLHSTESSHPRYYFVDREGDVRHFEDSNLGMDNSDVKGTSSLT